MGARQLAGGPRALSRADGEYDVRRSGSAAVLLVEVVPEKVSHAWSWACRLNRALTVSGRTRILQAARPARGTQHSYSPLDHRPSARAVAAHPQVQRTGRRGEPRDPHPSQDHGQPARVGRHRQPGQRGIGGEPPQATSSTPSPRTTTPGAPLTAGPVSELATRVSSQVRSPQRTVTRNEAVVTDPGRWNTEPGDHATTSPPPTPTPAAKKSPTRTPVSNDR